MSARDTRLDRVNRPRDPDAHKRPPDRWKGCPKMGEFIEDMFFPFKTPLESPKYDGELTSDQKFTVEDVFDECERRGKSISVWFDLTKSTRFYREQETQTFNSHPETKYMKHACAGHESSPDSQSTRLFIGLCEKFVKPSARKSVIGIHCTHGFNRTGFLICAFLIEKLDWSVDAAIAAFARCRPPGIYKENYIRDLYIRYEDADIAPAVPDLPSWCYEEESKIVENGSSVEASSSAGPVSQKDAKFMEGVPNVSLVRDLETMHRIRRKCKQYCRWNGETFPGCQPVSMDNDNKHLLADELFDVSWKADGVRYMLFIENTDQAFFIDRNNDVFQVQGMAFPKSGRSDEWIEETLLDGEMIFDLMPGGWKRPRYLIYDIVHFMDEDIGRQNFRTRCKRINANVIAPREEKAQAGKLNKDAEPFSIRWKNFYPVIAAKKLLGKDFSKQLSHEVDGLVFQPVNDPYIAGRCDKVLKWKPPEQCTIDFKLDIKKLIQPGMVPTTKGWLHVGGLGPAFGELRMSKAMNQHNQKILECSFDKSSNKWIFERVRTDKTFPNHFTTAKAVMKGIQNPLTKDGLLNFIETRAVQEGKTQPARASVIRKATDEGDARPTKIFRPDEPRTY